MLCLAVEFVQPGVEVKVAYYHNDVKHWYKGKVTKVGPVSRDGKGQMFIDTEIIYDGETDITKEVLYEHQFDNPGSDEAWTLSNDYTVKIINQLIVNQSSVILLRDELGNLTNDIRTVKNVIESTQQKKLPKRSTICSNIIYLFLLISTIAYVFVVLSKGLDIGQFDILREYNITM